MEDPSEEYPIKDVACLDVNEEEEELVNSLITV